MTWMLPPRAQRVLKVLHLASVALCIGGAASMLWIMRLKYVLGDMLDPLSLDTALYTLLNRAFMAPFYLVAATGLVYSLFTNWGFLRYRWIVLKWGGAVLLVVITLVWLAPAVAGMVGLADGYFTVRGSGPLYSRLFRQCVGALAASLGLSLFLVIVSVSKPWGSRTRGSMASVRRIRIVAFAVVAVLAAVTAAGSLSLHTARSLPIEHVEPALLPDGLYKGKASDGSFIYRVQVTVKGGTITGIEAVTNRASLYALVAEGVFAEAMNLQSPRADTITGATTTSKMLLKAVEDALKSGGLKTRGQSGS